MVDILLVTFSPHGDMELGQHSLRQWRGAFWHQIIIITNTDLSLKVSYGIHLRAISQEVHTNFIHNMCSKITIGITTPPSGQ